MVKDTTNIIMEENIIKDTIEVMEKDIDIFLDSENIIENIMEKDITNIMEENTIENITVDILDLENIM